MRSVDGPVKRNFKRHVKGQCACKDERQLGFMVADEFSRYGLQRERGWRQCKVAVWAGCIDSLPRRVSMRSSLGQNIEEGM